MYVNGNLVWGTEPDGTVPGDNEPVVTTPAVTTPAPVQTTPSVTTENTPAETTNPVTTENTTPEKEMLGDVNLDGKIDVTDLSTLSIILADNKPVSGMQKKNADVDRDGNVYLSDLARIRQYLSKIIEKF